MPDFPNHIKKAKLSPPPHKLQRRIKKLRGKLAYLERQDARLSQLKRRAHNRLTYELGLLVTKAGLRPESDEVLFRLALEASQQFRGKEADTIRLHYRILGDIGFQHGEKLIGQKLYNELTHRHGGLIIKAGLHHETRAVVFGVLLEAKEKLDDLNGQALRLKWQNKGVDTLSIAPC